MSFLGAEIDLTFSSVYTGNSVLFRPGIAHLFLPNMFLENLRGMPFASLVEKSGTNPKPFFRFILCGDLVQKNDIVKGESLIEVQNLFFALIWIYRTVLCLWLVM